MKAKFFLVTLILVNCSLNIASAQSTFQKLYGNIEEFNYVGTFGATVIQTSDSGFILIGINRDSINTGFSDIYLIKTNKFGDTLWTKIYGTISSDDAFNIVQTTDGGYAFCGSSNGSAILVKTNSFGDTLWTKKYNTTLYSIATCLKQTSDNGFILGGYAAVGTWGNEDFLLLKTDSAGNLQFAKTYGGSLVRLDRSYSVVEDIGTGYTLAGSTASFSFMFDNIYVVKTDLNGNLLWSKKYGETRNAIGRSIQKTLDGGYVVAGLYERTAPSFQNISVIKIDSVGNLIWSKEFDCSTYDAAFYIESTMDSGFIVTGYAQPVPILIKLNSNGDIQWTKTNTITNSSGQGFCVRSTIDGGYVFISSFYNSSTHGLTLIKTDSLGSSCLQVDSILNIITPSTLDSTPQTQFSTLSIQETSLNLLINSWGTTYDLCSLLSSNDPISNSIKIKAIPNPFTTHLLINGTSENGKIRLFDLSGREILQQQSLNNESNINTEVLPTGFYLLNYSESNKNANIKIIKY